MRNAPTHRLLFHEGHGFIAKRELLPEDQRDVDGWPVWGERDDTLLMEASERMAVPTTELRNATEIFEVAFVPKDGFEETGLEALTDDELICPTGTYAAFESIR